MSESKVFVIFFMEKWIFLEGTNIVNIFVIFASYLATIKMDVTTIVPLV